MDITILVLLFLGVYHYTRNTTVDDWQDEWNDVAESSCDYRDDLSKRGMLCECWYCQTYLLFDGDGEDFSISEPETHCDDCTKIATINMCG